MSSMWKSGIDTPESSGEACKCGNEIIGTGSKSSGPGSGASEEETLMQIPAVSRRRVRLPVRVLCVCTGALALLVVAVLSGAGPGRGSQAPARCRHCTQRHGPRFYEEQGLSEAPKHPHVVVIVLDDVGYGDMKPWAKDSTVVLTPNIDRLANEGMALDRHYSQVRCSPSRAALLTGRYPIRYGLQSKVLNPVKPYGLPASEITMAQVLKSAGYATHMVGKWHLGFHVWNATPTFRGFDTWFGISEGEADHYNYTINVDKVSDVNVLFWQAQPNCGDGCTIQVERRQFSSSLWTEEAVRIVEEHNHSVPLFLYLCYTGPHAPCEAAPQPYSGLYPHVEDPKRKVYAEMLSAVDGGIGNVTAVLSKKGMLQDTILVVLSDNGGPVGFTGQASRGGAEHCEPFGKWGADTGASNYPLRGGKGAAFEGGARTPALIHYPRQIPAGRRFAGLAHITDWLPTILAAASVDDSTARAAFPLDGLNLWSALLENSPSPRRELLVDIDANGVGTGGALIHNFTKLFVGRVFNETNFWAVPPEMALVRNLSAKDDPIFAPAMMCSQGCLFDLETDPNEQHPRSATADDKDLMDAYEVYQQAVAPSLFYEVAPDVKAFSVYKKLHSTWPYKSKDKDTRRAPITG